MIGSILMIIIVLALVVPTVYAFHVGAPILFTPKSSIRQALEFCEVKKGRKFYDLGCGTGRNVIVAAKEFNLDSVGLELSPILFLISRMNLSLSRVPAEIRLKNMYKVDLSQADVVCCFLTPKAMRKLAPKFERELKSGAKIISYCFRLPDWEPLKIIDTDNPGKIFIYEKK
ncbi:MAG: 50S ribosomal protein L11 methyltransferase [Parcubacteria group bacterium]